MIGCNNGGIWNEEAARLSFAVAPFFYQTAGFGILVAAGVLLLAFAWHRLRLRRLRASFDAVLAERGRIARELHDTLDQGLTAVGMQIQAASKRIRTAPEQAQQSLELAQQFLDATLQEGRGAVWALRSQALEAGGLAGAFARLARELMAGSEVRIQVEVEGQAHALASETEGHLLRIGYEAVTNAIKHAAPGNITIELAFDPGRLLLRVRDDGRGFDPSIPASGWSFGLRGMHERARQIKAALTITSRPGAGTEVLVELPGSG